MPKEKKAPKAEPAAKKPKRNTHRLGNSFIFTPEVIDDIHIKAELGRYRMRGFSLFKKIPTWDDLTFLPGTLTFDCFGHEIELIPRTLFINKTKYPWRPAMTIALSRTNAPELLPP